MKDPSFRIASDSAMAESIANHWRESASSLEAAFRAVQNAPGDAAAAKRLETLLCSVSTSIEILYFRALRIRGLGHLAPSTHQGEHDTTRKDVN